MKEPWIREEHFRISIDAKWSDLIFPSIRNVRQYIRENIKGECVVMVYECREIRIVSGEFSKPVALQEWP